MKRLIPIVLLQRGMVVRAEGFRHYQKIGNPVHTIQRLSSWSVDELIILERASEQGRDPYLDRKDIETSFIGEDLADLLRHISPWTFMPLTVGGGITSVSQMRQLFDAGADKVSINTAALCDPELIKQAALEFGSQSVVVSIDAILRNNTYYVATESGQTIKDLHPADWAGQCQELGAGEILLTSIDRDGSAQGLDHILINKVAEAVTLPIIAAGGVGAPSDIIACFQESDPEAIAVANHFHFKELSYPLAKIRLLEAGISIRGPRLDTHWFPREPNYDNTSKRKRLAERLCRARRGREADGAPPSETPLGDPPPMQFCRQCVAPSSSAIPLAFDTHGVCSACQSQIETKTFNKPGPHKANDALREQIKNSSHTNADYDCIIAVSGGKDSYFQTYYIKEVLGLRPLLVTYYGNNYTPEGEANLNHMSHAFGVDHLVVKPGVETLRKLNWLGFAIMGDMNWHNHVGIATVPFQVAVEKKIPFVIYGEHGYADLGGQFSPRDLVEWTYRHRLEHFSRGYDWCYMVGLRGITAREMACYKYPSDTQLYELGIRGIFLANYTQWEGNQNAAIAQNFGFRPRKVKSQRTYRLVSNLDDMHENGVHDYLRWIKFGYGRCTDHACKDIRAGFISRKEGARLVRDHDHKKPDDLERWLSYVGMRESVFDRIADTFRDRRVWNPTKNGWVKRNVWDEYDDL